MQAELGQAPKRKVAPHLKNSNFAKDKKKRNSIDWDIEEGLG
jgi:hypothetical protein